MTAIRRYAHVESVGQTTDLDRLVVHLRQLAGHRGFDRDRVSSPLLRRFLPGSLAGRRDFTEGVARKRLVEARLDPNAVTYLIRSARDELAAAHAALA